MATYRDFRNDVPPAWCPGCGNWSIRNAMMRALPQAGLEPHQVLIVSGIGQASKLPDYMTVNSLTTLHGRPIPIAQGAKLANHEMKVIVHAGDGDTFGLGGNHYIHMMRRNADITLMVHDNLIYGLTKGQYSPTSPTGFLSKTSPKPTGAIEHPVNPLALAITMEATFVARTFAGDMPHMIEMMVAAVQHPARPCWISSSPASCSTRLLVRLLPAARLQAERRGWDTSSRRRPGKGLGVGRSHPDRRLLPGAAPDVRGAASRAPGRRPGGLPPLPPVDRGGL